MTLRTILEKAAQLVGVSVNFLQQGEEQTRFINAGKDALMRVSGEWYDVMTKETVTIDGDSIAYGELTKTVKRVLRVRCDGVAVSFSERSTGVYVGRGGTYEVTYAYLCDEPNFLDEVDLPPRFNVYVLALGTASEYCYAKGMYEEGKQYDERFVAAINNVIAGGKRVTLKAVGDV